MSSDTNIGPAAEGVLTHIRELIHAQGADQLHEPTRRLFSYWCSAVSEQSRPHLRLITEYLEHATDEAFLFGEGRRPQWSLTDWGHCWETVSSLGRFLLRLDKDGVRDDDKQMIQQFPNGPAYIKAFLDEKGESRPMSIKEIRERLYPDEGDKAIQKVFNQLARLAKADLVRRTGHQRGIYELTLRGRRVAEVLFNKEDLKTENVVSMESFLMRRNGNNQTKQAGGYSESHDWDSVHALSVEV
ncbi:MAG: hypothetical protein KJ558_04630 [Gammaproteobacteria bacterium]|nr:hypothetical protein [Gammaproteobacteria bacterium]MBU1654106.1 hypothetical protein [Gammaproteobacteria bacterium]MBU1961677.1 hypothetical protein [Gammaproteobacteria bacterium]